MKVNILGAEYSIEYKTDEEVAKDIGDDIGECGGYCNAYSKTIVIAKQDTSNGTEEIKKAVEQRDLRHEIIHAFLHESGIYENSQAVDNWAMNEEMVDWMALQFPKMLKAFEEVGAIEDNDKAESILYSEGIPYLNLREKAQASYAETAKKRTLYEVISEIGEESATKALRVSGADKPSNKIYIVVRAEEGFDGDWEETNEEVFTAKKKAVEYIKSKGYTLKDPYGNYHDPAELEVRAGDLTLKEWEERVKEYSQSNLPRRGFVDYWLETVRDKGDIMYCIEEHGIDISE